MPKQIVILEEGGCDPVVGLSWCRDLAPDELTAGRPEAWDELCLAVVSRWREEPAPPLEVFVCLDDRELAEAPDRRELQELLRRIRDRSWGAQVFLVASRELLLEPLIQDGRESRHRFLETALEERVTDLLQVRYDRENLRQLSGHDLRAAADHSRERWRLTSLHRLQVPGRWLCYLPTHEKTLFQLLRAWTQEASGPANRLIVVNVTSSQRQIAVVEEALAELGSPAGGVSYLVATLRKPSRELVEHCRRRGLGEPLEFKGGLELWYFLLRLDVLPPRAGMGDERSAFEASPAEAADPGDIRSVEADLSPVFTSPPRNQPPVLLVTSAFDPDERRQCLEAARDVGWLVERCPVGTRLRVEPAITLGKLFSILDRFAFNIWIHLGHGNGSSGLEVAHSMIPPETWLQCFRERHLELSLALFLSCHSTPVARRFAEAGAGVAIGFDEEVYSRLSRELAVHVLEEIVDQGLHPAAILRGFRRGCHRVAVQEASPSQPTAFSRWV